MRYKSYDEFLKSIVDNDGLDHWYEFGRLNKRMILLIKKFTGKDLGGYSRIITKSSIRHTLNEHGPESKDVVKVGLEDFALIPLIVKCPDKIKLSEKLVRSTKSECIIYEKTIGDKFYYLEEIRTGRKKVALVSLYKTPAKQKV